MDDDISEFFNFETGNIAESAVDSFLQANDDEVQQSTGIVYLTFISWFFKI